AIGLAKLFTVRSGRIATVQAAVKTSETELLESQKFAPRPAPPIAAVPTSSEPQPPGGRARENADASKRRRAWAARVGGALAAAVIAVTGWSYAHALTAPGTDGVGVRSVEWLRGHGGAGIVSTVERWWYSHHQPPKGGRPPPMLAGSGPPSRSHGSVQAPNPSTASASTTPVQHLPAPS